MRFSLGTDCVSLRYHYAMLVCFFGEIKLENSRLNQPIWKTTIIWRTVFRSFVYFDKVLFEVWWEQMTDEPIVLMTAFSQADFSGHYTVCEQFTFFLWVITTKILFETQMQITSRVGFQSNQLWFQTHGFPWQWRLNKTDTGSQQNTTNYSHNVQAAFISQYSTHPRKDSASMW